MITADDVKAASRFILGNELEDEEFVAGIVQRCSSLTELRRLLLGSPEFRRTAPATTDDIRAAYRLILGREPENDQVVADINSRCYSLAELRQVFLKSHEFRATANVPDMAKPLDWAPIPIETEASPAELARMLHRIETYWRELDVPEVHRPLHLCTDFISSDFTENERHFYGSGQEVIDIFQRTAERCGVSLDRYKVCLELGCGVGRLTVWLSELFQKIIGVDISRLRIELNQRALRQFHRTNVEHHHLVAMASVAALPDFDAFFSIIVLQHNPPPIIASLLKTILGKLRPGGIAYFQVPTFLKDYTFTIESYLRETPDKSLMEMHPIPQKCLFDIINGCNCELLEIREDPWTESNIIISNSIFVEKSANE